MKSTQPKGMFAFTLVWFGQVISLMGSAMSGFIITIWAWEKTGLATALSIVAVCNFLPALLAAPFAGALVDRWNKKVVMIISDLVAGLTTVGLLIIYAVNPNALQIWHLCVAGVISGLFQSFQWPAYSAGISLMIPKEQYSRAAGMMSLAEFGSGIFAPVLAGALYAPIGLVGIFIIDIITFVFAILMVLIVHIPDAVKSEEGKAAEGNLLKEAAFGFKYIFTKANLLFLQLVFFAGNLLSSIGMVLIAPMILARTGNNATLLGTVESFGALGGVLGGLLISAWGGFKKRKIHGVLLGWALSGAFGLAFMGFSRTIPFWIAGSFFWTFVGPIINSYNQAIWQSKVPPDIQGRVFSVRRVIAQITGPLGLGIAGPLADRLFEPMMAKENFLTPIFGSSKGAGMALLIAITGVLTVFVGIGGYLNKRVWNVEMEIPDHDQAPKQIKSRV
jgi:MFS transporter, DHA3 family, macrolide efflux protein